MKILHVTNFFKPSWDSGGPARVAYEITKKLVDDGHDVTVYTTDGYRSRLNIEKNKPVNVEDLLFSEFIHRLGRKYESSDSILFTCGGKERNKKF